MSLHRRAAKRDANEPDIVSALEALGCVVWRVSGKGLPDLIVLRAGKKWLADVKGAKEKPTPAQEKAWEEAATKARCAVFILRTPEDAQRMLNNALQPWEPERVTKDKAVAAAYGVAYDPDIDRAAAKAPKVAIHSSAFYPPRSTPFDAAKEAGETFAPDLATRPCGCIGRKHIAGCGKWIGYGCTCGGEDSGASGTG